MSVDGFGPADPFLEDEQPGLPPPVRPLHGRLAAPRAVAPEEDPLIPVADAAAGPERMRLEGVSVAYGPSRVVKDVSLSIRQGQVLALIGPSGCGKTTLLRTLNRLTETTSGATRDGAVLLDGEEVERIEVTALRRRIAMVFQQPNPFPMSIFDNVAYAIRVQNRKRPGRKELEPQVTDALRRAGLLDELGGDLDRPALRLSGGQQQRLCIARAIATRPEVLLMDEPCSALDPKSTAVIEQLIGELRQELAIVIVTHNLAQARRVGDRVAFMYLGDLVEQGPAEQLFTEPRAERTRDYVAGAFG